MTVAEYVWDWHNVEGCHKHSDASVAEGVCCVCDAEDPCNYPLDDAKAYDEATCAWRTAGVRCTDEATFGQWCGDHVVDAREDDREQAQLARAEAGR